MENEKVIRGFGILYRTFLSYITKSLSTKDLSFSDSVFLVNIGNKEGISQEEIANSLAIDRAAIARSVKNMEEKGYLRTERSSVDKRAKELYLSDSGEELYKFMQGLHQEWIDYVMGDMEPDEIKAFAEIIDHISKRALTYNR